MHSDFSLEKDALSCGNDHFQYQMNQKKLNIKNPAPPPGHFFEKNIFFLDSLNPLSNYQSIKLVGPQLYQSEKKLFHGAQWLKIQKCWSKQKTSNFGFQRNSIYKVILP